MTTIAPIERERLVETRPTTRRLEAAGRRLLSVSLDLDNLWSYMKTHGDAGWESFPTYLEPLVEIVLERLAAHALGITVFVVGQDAALDKNADALSALARAGHDIANHSFHHEPWLHRYSRAEIEDEISRAEDAIHRATGTRPRGFRGPGFSISRDALASLAGRDYDYDASTFPTFLGPLARAYYFWASRGLSRDEREQRSRLFGTFREGFRPLRPYLWRVEGRELLEIPVTTMPLARVPFHLSYLIYLAGHSRALFRFYLRAAVAACRTTGTEPSFLLHPLDFLGADKVSELSFFPGMQLDTATKLALFDEVFAYLSRKFDIVDMATHAHAIRSGAHGDLRRLNADDLS